MVPAVAASRVVPAPAWKLSYAGQNITANISKAVTGILYNDKAEHGASEIEVQLEDRGRMWQRNPPAKGDVLSLFIGYEGALTPCGLFQVDENTLEGPPDEFRMKGISASITAAMRTHFSRSYEGQTLAQIANTIAMAHGLTVVGAPADIDVTVQRITQKHETDLAFLRRVANLYGYNFNLKGQQLVFEARTRLETAPSVLTITRGLTPVIKFSFTAQSWKVYKAATVSYFDPATKQLVTATAEADPPVPEGDVYAIPEKVQDGQEAQAKADAALHGNNMHEGTCTLTLEGDARLGAGLNIDLSGWGAFDGKYQIEQTRHRLIRNGAYTVEVNGRRAGTPSTKKHVSRRGSSASFK